MEIVNVLHSTVDNTVKFKIKDNISSNILEFSFINKNDGKHIICVPTQSSCNMKCVFCPLTYDDKKTTNINYDIIYLGVNEVLKYMNSTHDKQSLNKIREETLLISFMGSGEPLLNSSNLLKACLLLNSYKLLYTDVRFAVATIIPSRKVFKAFSDMVKSNELNIKMHLSLHSIDQVVRSELMPRAMPIIDSLKLLQQYADDTGNEIEIHHTLIKDVNDSESDLNSLLKLLKKLNFSKYNVTYKLLSFSEGPEIDLKKSDNYELFEDCIKRIGIRSEIYLPPGSDIGAGCGQFDTSE